MTTISSRARRGGSWRAAVTVPALAATTLLAPAFTPAASAADGDAAQRITGWCEVAPDLEDITSTSAPVALNVPSAGDTHAARADAAQLDVGAATDLDWNGSVGTVRWEACGTNADFRQVLTVGAGTSGLAPGAPVTLDVDLSFAATMHTSNDETFDSDAGVDVFASMQIEDPTATCTPSPEGGWCFPEQALRFSADGERESHAMDTAHSNPDGYLWRSFEWGWSLDTNLLEDPMEEQGEDDGYVCTSFPCTVYSGPGLPSPMDPTVFGTGARTVQLATTVGAQLIVTGKVNTDTRASGSPANAAVDALDGIAASLAGQPGSGVEVLLGTGPFTPPDTTAPSVELTASPAPHAAGWNNGDVTVSYAATDEAGGSGVAQLVRSATGAHAIPSAVVPGSSGSDVLSTEGITEVQVAAQDAAGNTSEPTTTTVRIDRTAPTVTATAPAPAVADSGGTAVVSYAATATDALDSAPALSCTAPSGSAFPVGTTSVTCTATDHAGNTAAQSFDVVVTAAPGGGGGDGGEVPLPTAAEQVEALRTAVFAMDVKTGVRSSLVAHLRPLQRSLTSFPHLSCNVLARFVEKVELQAGKGLNAAQLADLRTRTARLATTLDC